MHGNPRIPLSSRAGINHNQHSGGPIVKRTRIIAAVLAAGLLLAGGIIAASMTGAAAAKPAPAGPHWVTQTNSVLIPANTSPPTYTIGCATGEALLGFQTSGSYDENNGNGFGSPIFAADGFPYPMGYAAAQRQVTVPTSTINYTPFGVDPNGPGFDITVRWTIAVLCEAAS